MKWLQGTYTQRFNARHQIFGHLFQGRYKALIVEASSEEYFQTLSTYIHLNPARAGLIQIGQEPLKSYPWSSYPYYLSRPTRRPAWLQVDRVLASLGIDADNAKGRRGYEAYVEGRVLELTHKNGRQEFNSQWRQIRRGWYLGEKGFRRWLEEHLDKALEGKARQSFSGGAKRTHDEAAAESLLFKGLDVLGFTEENLTSMPKGALEKQVLAWWLRKHTVVSRTWISRRLHRGDESRVTQAVRAIEHRNDRPVVRMRKQLTHLHS